MIDTIERILFVGGLLALGAYLTFLWVFPPQPRVVSVLHDLTDTQIAVPTPAKIESLYKLNEDQWQGATFRYAALTDVSLNATHEKSLPQVCSCFSNEFERAKDVRAFSSFITETLASKEEIGRTHSSVYLPIARELIALKNMRAEDKYLIVYSDLMENSPDMSMYDPRIFQKLQSEPEYLKNYFDHKLQLPQLSGMTIYLIYQPPNTKADAEYQEVSGFYKKLLESKGATVHIQANL